MSIAAPGMARSALTGAVNRRAKATREVTWAVRVRLGALVVGTPSRTATAVTARWRGEEAAGKALARGTRTAYEASVWWAKRPKDLKPDTTRIGRTYMRRVDGAKVTRLTLGGLLICQVLVASQGAAMGEQKSAEAIRAARAGRQRAKHVETNRHDAFDGR